MHLPPQSKQPQMHIEEVSKDDFIKEVLSSISITSCDNVNLNANLKIISQNFFCSQFRRIVLTVDQQVIKKVFDTMMNSIIMLIIH